MTASISVEQNYLIQMLTQTKELALHTESETVSKVIQQVESFLRDATLSNDEMDKAASSLKRLCKGIRWTNQEKIDAAAKEIDCIYQSDSLLKSIVVFENNLIGTGYDHRRGVCTETHVAPKEYLHRSPIEISIKGYPASKKTQDEYEKALLSYKGEKAKVNWIVADQLGSLALNIPGERMFEQVEKDISRTSLITVDGKKVYSLKDPVQPVFDVYKRLEKYIGGNPDLTKHFSKLLTQASLARVYYIMSKRLIKDSMQYFLQSLDCEYHISTKTPSGELGKTIVLKQVATFAVSQFSFTGEKKDICYFKYISVIDGEREQFSRGIGDGARATDYFSRAFKTVEEMEEYDLSSMPEVQDRGGCIIS